MLTRRHCTSAIALSGLSLAAGPAAVGSARAASVWLRVGGTGMALTAMRLLGEGFAAQYPGAGVEVMPSLGSDGGLAAVRAGVIDVALVDRPLGEAERAFGLDARAYARTPMAFVTHAGTAATGISTADVSRVLRGEITVWPDGTPLRLVRREPLDADWAMLRALSTEIGEAVEVALRRPGLLTVGTDQENAEALEGRQGSFGAMSLGQLRAEALRLRPLSLDGIAPGVGAAADGRYPLWRTLRVAWRGEPDPLLRAFLDFLRSPEAGALLLRVGHDAPGADA